MNRATLATAAAVVTVAALAGCSSSSKTATPAAAPAASAQPAASSAAPAAPSPAAKPTVDAAQAIAAITKAVASSKTGTTVTADNDPNHLLGRPGQYTSKVTFTDSRIQASDVEGLDNDDVERGGAIEVFATAADAKARADYIQGIVKSMPMLLEYDFPHGPVLVRVSKFLTASQAADYDKAGATLG